MIREKLINKTIERLKKLPDSRLKEASDYIDFLAKKLDEENLTQGIQKLASISKSFKFLENEEDIYSVEDLKEVYNEKR